jgi:hypothetical protein
MTSDTDLPRVALPYLRLGLLWLCSAGAAWFFFWSVNPFSRRYFDDVFEFFLSWVWFAGPVIALASSLALVVLRPAALHLVRTLSLIHLGVGIALSAVALAIRWSQTATEMTFGLCVVIVVGVLANVPVWLLAPRAGTANVSIHRSLGMLALSLTLPILALVVWSYLNILVVEGRAIGLTGTSPYCLQVADGAGYREANRHSDLAGFAMQSPYERGGSEDYQFAFHAMLIVDEGGSKSHYNWSYMSQTFVPVRSAGLFFGVVCTPRVGFVQTLS